MSATALARAWRVRWVDGSGTLRDEIVRAGDRLEALSRAATGRVLALDEVNERGAPATRWARRSGFELRLFAQELSVLLEAGVPLVESLRTLGERAGRAGPLPPVIAALEEGQPLSAALARSGAAFDALFVAVVAASERHGQLAPTLRDHAAFLHWSATLRHQLVAAAVYPAALLSASLAVVLFLLLYVLPRFSGVFEGIGAELPAASRWLLEFGSLAAQHRGFAIAIAVALPVSVLAAMRSRRGRAAIVTLAWRMPGLATSLRTLALARLYRCLGLLLGAGVPVPQAMRLAADALPLPLREPLARAVTAVESGTRLSHAMHANTLATPVALRMLRVGEGSGQAAAMFMRAAGFHDEEITRLADIVSRAVNPALMVVMGVLIGGLVVLMYLPIFTLMEQVG